MAELLLRTVVVEILENWSISLDAMGEKGEKESVGGDGGDEEENMDWPWDDEMWIHHPDLFLRCKPLK